MPHAPAPPQPATIDLTKPGGWAQGVLANLHAPHDPKTLAGQHNIAFLEAWAAAEGTKARYNPLATTQRAKGSSSFNSTGVQSYAKPGDGVQATADTLKHYPGIVAKLRAGDPTAILNQSNTRAELNKWVTGRLAPPPSGWSYLNNISRNYFKYQGSAADWTSFDAKGAAGAAQGAAVAAAGAAKDAASAALGPLAKIAEAVNSAVKFLLSVDTWRRAGELIGGAVLVLSGLYLMAKSQGLAPSVVPIPV